MPRFWKPWWPWYGRALTVASAVFGVLQQLKTNNVPSQGIWTAAGPTGGLLITAGILNVFLVTVQLWRLTDRLVASRRAKSLKIAAATVLAQVCNASKMELWPTKMAVHVWVVPRRRGRIDHGRPLRRVCSYQIIGRHRSGVPWTIGKGVVGKAWRDEDGFVANLEPLVKAHDRGEATFAKRPEAFRLGMTFAEVHHTKRYSAVFAHPLYNMEGNLIGIVSIDSTQHKSVEHLRASVSDEFVRSAIEGVESALAQLQAPAEETAE